MWTILLAMGQPLEARIHLDRGRALYKPEQHSYLRYRYAGHDPGACCSGVSAITHWLTGFPDRAQVELGSLRARIDELQHPMTSVILTVSGWVHFRLGELESAARLGTELIASARKHGFHAWAEPAIVLTELARCTPSSPSELREMSDRLMGGKSTRSAKLLMCSILLDICADAGDVDVAEALLKPLLDVQNTMHRAEFLRVHGALMLQRATPDAVAAERSFRNAIEVAREQGAKSFELRAATSLATLWHEQGKRNEARELLGGVYGWFTEGFNTPDLQRAKSLLDDWAIA